MTEPDAHARVFLDYLEADDQPPALVVHDEVVPPEALPPYVLVRVVVTHPPPAVRPSDASMEMLSDRVVATAYCYSVGLNGKSARMIAGRVSRALLDKQPTIEGRICFPIRHIDGSGPQPDQSTGKANPERADIYSLETKPA